MKQYIAEWTTSDGRRVEGQIFTADGIGNQLKKLESWNASDISIKEYQEHATAEKNGSEIEEHYSPTTDTTFLMECTYKNGNLREMEVISFYSGEPNAHDTYYYTANRSTKAIFNS